MKTCLSDGVCLRAEIPVEQLSSVGNIDDVSSAVVWDVGGLESAVAVFHNFHIARVAIGTLWKKIQRTSNFLQKYVKR